MQKIVSSFGLNVVFLTPKMADYVYSRHRSGIYFPSYHMHLFDSKMGNLSPKEALFLSLSTYCRCFTLARTQSQLAIFFDFSDVDDVMHNQFSLPIRRKGEKRFRDFVRINFAHTLKKTGIAEADGYSESWQQQVLKSFIKN